ncbi:MAG: O-antigen ligase domain-containing protein [Gammaproteobacteria bacterium]|nr:O-antigen ligase domain-containing protein [Gammaproteobacteria bacterium]
MGALYLLAPVLGWALLALLILRWSAAQPLPQQNSTWLIYLWIGSAMMLQLCLIIGHVDFNLGLAKLIKSTVGWAKGWALLSIFVVLGFCLNVRYQLICRAACVIGLIALLLTPLLVFAYATGLPGHLYVSPLKILGGAGAEYFTVILYEIDPFNGAPRWRFFAPWAPAVGFVANLYFLCAWFEKDFKWRLVGLLGNALMILMAASRMGMLVMLIVPLGVWALSRLTRPWIIISAACCVLGLVLLFEPVSQQLMTLLGDIKAARADSTRVREALANIALYRWQAEAFWFGHGAVETGTHLVEFMPIGSHHNWYGLLFVKGMVGFLGFLIPFLVTACVLLVKAQYQVSSRLALSMCLILGFFSLSENIEALAYLTWPAWLLIGIGLRSSIQDIDTNNSNLLAQFRLLSERLNTQTERPVEAN